MEHCWHMTDHIREWACTSHRHIGICCGVCARFLCQSNYAKNAVRTDTSDLSAILTATPNWSGSDHWDASSTVCGTWTIFASLPSLIFCVFQISMKRAIAAEANWNRIVFVFDHETCKHAIAIQRRGRQKLYSLINNFFFCLAHENVRSVDAASGDFFRRQHKSSEKVFFSFILSLFLSLSFCFLEALPPSSLSSLCELWHTHCHTNILLVTHYVCLDSDDDEFSRHVNEYRRYAFILRFYSY